MLALTRKKGESLVLGNDIEVTVLEIRGDQVKLGIKAPRQVPVYRQRSRSGGIKAVALTKNSHRL